MKYAEATSFRMALEQRLKNLSRETGVPIQRLRKLVVFDQLLRRFAARDRERWVLKGAVALDLRFGTAARPTNDLDLFWNGPPESCTESIRYAETVDAEGYFDVVFERTSKLDDAEDFSAARYRAHVSLANRRFETVSIDIGFDGELIDHPDHLPGPALLEFADIGRIEVSALPLAQHVAEKIHAYSRIYARSRPSSRVKDLVDLVIIALHAAFSAGQLRLAVESTFTSRSSHPIPQALPLPPDSWIAGYRQMASNVGITPDLSDGYQLASAFIDPVLAGKVTDAALWDPISSSWQE